MYLKWCSGVEDCPKGFICDVIKIILGLQNGAGAFTFE